MPIIYQNLQPFTDNGDVFKWVINFRAGRKTPKKQKPKTKISIGDSKKKPDGKHMLVLERRDKRQGKISDLETYLCLITLHIQIIIER